LSLVEVDGRPIQVGAPAKEGRGGQEKGIHRACFGCESGCYRPRSRSLDNRPAKHKRGKIQNVVRVTPNSPRRWKPPMSLPTSGQSRMGLPPLIQGGRKRTRQFSKNHNVGGRERNDLPAHFANHPLDPPPRGHPRGRSPPGSSGTEEERTMK